MDFVKKLYRSKQGVQALFWVTVVAILDNDHLLHIHYEYSNGALEDVKVLYKSCRHTYILYSPHGGLQTRLPRHLHLPGSTHNSTSTGYLPHRQYQHQDPIFSAYLLN